MTLRDLSYAMRAAADVARAGEHLLASMDRSRRIGLAPVLLGVALGLGLGAVLFRDDARARALAWIGVAIPAGRSANGAPAEPRDEGRVAPRSSVDGAPV